MIDIIVKCFNIKNKCLKMGFDLSDNFRKIVVKFKTQWKKK